ncbi:MFS transporter [Acidaminobacter sp. JC074]|uniref:MFS transporter n=1 Tax=Acidaminobacter sp. JC074 TaxID=2530199 RepID=UPI001F105D3A|nr:MFS transporter [Acidaminobacter sp. JC074]MCH4886066.1 MFS transporter [Acidaminobacter sp. JC074]
MKKNLKWIIWGVLALAYVVVFFHRLAAGVVKEDLMQTFSISSTTFGLIGSLYFYAYMFMQIPSGILADTLGAKRTVTYGTLVAGIGSLVFGFASNVVMIFIGRILVGLGVSVIFISLLKILADWFEPENFGRMSGITSFVGNMGGILAQTPLALVVAAFSWRHAFIGMGLVTLVICLMCKLIIVDKKKEVSEKVDIKKGLLIVIKNKHTWPGFVVFAGLFGAFASMTGTWGRAYMSDVYGLTKVSSANYMAIMVLGMALGSIVTGMVSDKVKLKKMPMVVLASINVISWGFFVLVNLPLQMIGPLLFVMGWTTSAFVLSWGAAKEVNPKEITGISTSVVNMGGFFGAAIVPVIMGRIFDSYAFIDAGAYKTAFLVCLFSSLFGLVGTFFIKETHCENIYDKREVA